jgi:hypothetical protein
MMKKWLLPLFVCFTLIATAQKNSTSGYCLMRVFDVSKFAGSGTYFVGPKIILTYETGEQEIIEMLPYTEKNELENLKTMTNTLNVLKQKGYLLMTTTTTGDQGNLVTDYVFLKQF